LSPSFSFSASREKNRFGGFFYSFLVIVGGLGGGLETVKESFSVSVLSRSSCYEGNGLCKGSGCELQTYEILGHRKT
jgi:hypothetical protein